MRGSAPGVLQAVTYPPETPSGLRLRALLSLVSGPLILWPLLWIAIDTGPWNFAGYAGLVGTMDAVRAALPLAVLAIALFWWALHAWSLRIPTLAEGGLWLYGGLMLLMSVRATPWFFWGYWGLAYLSVLALSQMIMSGPAPLEYARRLNVSSWLLATSALTIMMIYARNRLFVGQNSSAYGISNQVGPILGSAISRSSGMSRLAAVPAILGLIYVLTSRGRTRLIAAAVLVAASWVIWIMQSRGSLFSFLGSVGFILCFGGPRTRRWGIAIGVLSTLALMIDLGLGGRLLVSLWEHATRHTGIQGFQTMSGRPRIWAHALRFIARRPWLGYGPEADRRLGIGDAQNVLVYALLATGIVGTVAFVMGFAAAWFAFFKVSARRAELSPHDRTLVIATGAILAFMTLRGIPEDGATYFSVDLLLQLPAMTYLAVLARKLKRGPESG